MNFIEKRKLWYALSLIVIIAGLISLLVQGFNFGIDFTGGSLIHLKFVEKKVETEQLRSTLADFKLEQSYIQESSDGGFIIKTVELDQAKQDEVLKGIESKLGKYELLRSEKVGPVVGRELRINGLLALGIASVLMVVYITVRFEFKFAIAAILALLHDVAVTVGIFSIFQIEVDSAFIAAILTIIGYSINDTIVIFDRIRENLKNRRKETLEEIINNSITQTLTRSINTVLTVIFVLVALLVLGGETTKVFSLAMLVGIISGAYSSIFVASPLWFEFRTKGRKSAGQVKA
ncbi:protein translocase subunit SecF [Thermanaerosceptrum fracticalcis]|uniref:Protein-export membrane protein SecF n=1 Tax=Thermanaerosceptrum fracticalcis TaxID=1712410 RepID=A0A7G6DZN8_THEFR|nr:protein translocase subunit SecF [Thermanaerosceptrum fracticalcis]QNB45292.1 protein translocase subunit SecF [Thermanaerosceptrum fracticalcis]